MNKKIRHITCLLLTTFTLVLLGSCGSDNDDYEVSEEWKDYQRNLVTKVQLLVDDNGEKVYKDIPSESGLGSIFHKDSDYITKHEGGDFDGDEPSAFALTKSSRKIETPIHDTDGVIVRYEGWFYSLDDKRIVFDSTEIDITTGKSLNNTAKRTFASIGTLADGFRTLLKDMKVGEERIVCIPHMLGYGVYGNTEGTIRIPGYTTLFFDVKLLEVKERK